MLKVNKLEQFIKKSNLLYWAVKNEYNYISNDFSIMKIKDIPEQIKFRLLTLFKEVPENETALRYDGFGVVKDDAVFKLLKSIEACNTVPAIDTELMWVTVETGRGKSKGVRIFKTGNKTVYIPAEIMELFNNYDGCVYADGWIQFKKDNEWFLIMGIITAEKNQWIKGE